MRGRKSARIVPQFERIFMEKSLSLYGSMAYRKPIRMAGGLPFTLGEWREWLLSQLEGKYEGITRCPYCSLIMHIKMVVPDHRVALSCGGGHGLDNLDLTCDKCNRIKGKMSADGFRALVAFLLTLPDPRDMGDVLSRLGTGAEGAKMMWKRHSKPAGGLF